MARLKIYREADASQAISNIVESENDKHDIKSVCIMFIN